LPATRSFPPFQVSFIYLRPFTHRLTHLLVYDAGGARPPSLGGAELTDGVLDIKRWRGVFVKLLGNFPSPLHSFFRRISLSLQLILDALPVFSAPKERLGLGALHALGKEDVPAPGRRGADTASWWKQPSKLLKHSRGTPSSGSTPNSGTHNSGTLMLILFRTVSLFLLAANENTGTVRTNMSTSVSMLCVGRKFGVARR
jgi:hypothetical protein